LIAFHSKNPSTGMMQRRLRYASRNVGQIPHGLAFGVDRFAATRRVISRQVYYKSAEKKAMMNLICSSSFLLH